MLGIAFREQLVQLSHWYEKAFRLIWEQLELIAFIEGACPFVLSIHDNSKSGNLTGKRPASMERIHKEKLADAVATMSPRTRQTTNKRHRNFWVFRKIFPNIGR